MRFADRGEAGARLAREVAAHSPRSPLVAALPRGGVPVGFQVAEALGCELDVVVVRKIGVPFHPELAMGAVAEGGVVIENREIVRGVGIDESEFASRAEMEREEMEARVARYRATVPAVDPAGRTVVVVDDGLATGSTALAAIAALRARDALEVWLAVPVAPPDVTPVMTRAADRFIVLEQPRRFVAVGAWYDDFSPTSDAEVVHLLERSRRPRGNGN
ncbi:MAG TPA: phosphoribosyltransferase family protein [Acidimicrobiia bacterium]|nr:phosphoribosyltransferase family protein [Acidimicrobiia bacterium]